MPNVTLVALPTDLEPKLLRQDEAGGALLELPRATPGEIEAFKQEYFEWDDFNVALLEASFDSSGWMTKTPVGDYRSVGALLVDIKLNQATPGIPEDRIDAVLNDIRAKCGVLRSIAKRLDVYPRDGANAQSVASQSGSAIFIVHGHALLRRENVRRFLEQVTGQQVIVLEDEANQGHDVLGKLLTSAEQAAYAVVLLTGDDEGRKIGDGEWRPRARQNVVLELGLFLGMLGRSKVAALYEGGVEIPSDFMGVVYISLDDEGWKMKLATELKSAGIEVDMNKAI
ncbi:nucleotide-binding protein [Umezawaea sp. Da 62-37]|uniref:nucleotide-binding protein n=1 Tax=Umezawaea sp. Da 62-37 TaxID=3075927 RepID=UPI0028F6F5B7|nr:nucleotide-binding protein [Umezawaea sp. Da 62-37]WNV83491.1 nucleotide-binding protein [Umezawaea sp. Da 62-37]